MKTPIMTAAVKPIDKLEMQAKVRFEEEMEIYEKRLNEWEEGDKTEPKPTRPKMARYKITDITIESIQEVLRDDGEGRVCAPCNKVLALHDEMSGWFANFGRYSGGKSEGDRAAYLQLYNGGRYAVDRINRGHLSISHWSAGLMGGIQPGPIQKVARQADEDGLMQRFIYSVPGPQNAGLDRAPSREAINRYEDIFPALANFFPGNQAGTDRPVHAILHDHAHKHREDIDLISRGIQALGDTTPHMKAALQKWPGLFARLCLTFHMINVADAKVRDIQGPHPYVVPEETARQVALLMRQIILPHLIRAHAIIYSTEQTARAKWVAGYILAHSLKVITARDIIRVYRALSSPEARKELNEVMTSLTSMGWIEPRLPENPVNQVSVWDVNPQVHILFTEAAERERTARQEVKDSIAANAAVIRRARS